jgi:hypothetical protein
MVIVICGRQRSKYIIDLKMEFENKVWRLWKRRVMLLAPAVIL